MGFGVTELLIILAIVLVLFGAKKLRNVGGDLGGAIKNFKQAMNDDDDKDKDTSIVLDKKSGDAIENQADASFDQSGSSKTKESV